MHEVLNWNEGFHSCVCVVFLANFFFFFVKCLCLWMALPWANRLNPYDVLVDLKLGWKSSVEMRKPRKVHVNDNKKKRKKKSNLNTCLVDESYSCLTQARASWNWNQAIAKGPLYLQGSFLTISSHARLWSCFKVRIRFTLGPPCTVAHAKLSCLWWVVSISATWSHLLFKKKVQKRAKTIIWQSLWPLVFSSAVLSWLPADTSQWLRIKWKMSHSSSLTYYFPINQCPVVVDEERGRAMARTSSKVLAQVVVVMVLIAMVGGASAATICNIDTSKLAECLPAVSGRSPPPPTKACCTALLSADLHCLCNYKSALPAFGINPALAMALPKKCGGSLPPNCKGNKFKLHFSSSLWRSFIHHITAFLTWVPMPSC